MNILFIGGTGTISAAVSRLALEKGDRLFLLNRGNRLLDFEGDVVRLNCDINDEAAVRRAVQSAIGDRVFDAVADFITFKPEQVERDFRLFAGRTRQYIVISSASAYQKPSLGIPISESTPLVNPFWQYSRDKIAVEELCLKLYREQGFPVTIVRPSHTYDERSVPLAIHGDKGSYQVLKRILEGKPVIIHGDGTSLWTLTHNSDFARGFYGLIGNSRALGHAVGITSEEAVTWNYIYATIADALGKPLKAVHIASELLAGSTRYDLRGGLLGDKAECAVFDMSRLKRLVPGFYARVSVAQGLRSTVDYVMSHPECQRDDGEFDEWCDRVIAACDEARDALGQF
jgi:nucleoside-diphosphate-sugar epimerase